MELPYIFRTHLGDLPISSKYLHLPGYDAADRLPGAVLRVGLVWTAGSWNPARSIPQEGVAPLLAIDGCEFWNLEGDSERVSYPMVFGEQMKVDEHATGSIEGLARRIAQLDLVITVDTLAAHLAGALGVSTWLLLQHAADWRWMHGRDNSPW